jgi:serine/threonine protein kinase
VAEIVDKGAFGQVVKCIDMKEQGREVAVKISRNKKFDFDNGLVEYRILETIKQNDPTDSSGIVRVMDCFPFRKHMVLVFELLGHNLFKHQRLPGFKQFTMPQLKGIAKQLLQAMHFLREVVGVIHCDLKPENILFTDSNCESVKVSTPE